MPQSAAKSREERYAELLLKAIRVCKSYRPQFGAGRTGLTLEQFEARYGSDAFYSWLGLDNPLMYSAHKAAGGMTSLYRQIGKGCEWLFAQIIIDELGLSPADAVWSYTIPKVGTTKIRKLTLDARIPTDAVADSMKRQRIQKWMKAAGALESQHVVEIQ